MERKQYLTIIVAGATFLITTFAAEAALVVNPAQPITGLVIVQPIVVSNNNGSNTAEFFGAATEQSTIAGFVDIIWAQAGIDIEFLAPNFWNSTFANEGNSLPRPTSDLGTIVNNGATANVTNTNPSVINMFFVNTVPGFGSLNDNTAAGLAFIDSNGIAQFVGSNLLDFVGGLEVIASVVAHEIGHNLGLNHTLAAENLMGDGGERLNAAQVANVLDSAFVTGPVAVPLPAAGWMLASGLFGLAMRQRRQKAPVNRRFKLTLRPSLG